MKRCSKCGIDQPFANFYKASANRDRLGSWCKGCLREHRKQWRKDNYERDCESARRSYVKTKHGLTLEEYDEIIARGCAICGSHDRRMHLDHSHATGKTREALCGPCNQGLGLLGDDAARLRSAVDYLEKHSVLSLAAA